MAFNDFNPRAVKLNLHPNFRKAIADNDLSFIEILILKRVRAKESQSSIARLHGVTSGTVSRHLCRARERFGVNTNAELLALPRVQELLAEQPTEDQ